MKWFLNISFVGLLYILFGIYNVESKLISILIVVLLILSGFGNIIMSIISAFGSIINKNSLNSMINRMLFLKLSVIPFFILNFMLWTGLFGTLILFPGGIFLLALAPIIVLLTFTVLLVTSSSTISVLVYCYRAKQIDISKLIVHIVLQLIFVVDVIDSIYLYKILRKKHIDTAL
jgi:hypothetical protein